MAFIVTALLALGGIVAGWPERFGLGAAEMAPAFDALAGADPSLTWQGPAPVEAAAASVDPASLPGSFGSSVDPETGLRLFVWSGAGQSGRAGDRLPDILAVVLWDADGRPVSGVPVAFRVAAGGGMVADREVSTNDVGLASTVWRLGAVAESLSVTASVPERPALSVAFRATLDSTPEPLAPPVAGQDAPAASARADATRSDSSEDFAAPAQPVVAPPLSVPPRARLAAGGVHTCVLDDSAVPRCWGRSPEAEPSGSGAQAAGALPAVTTLGLGVLDVCVVTIDAAIFCWRAGAAPSTGRRATLPANIAAVQVVAAAEHYCALSSFGSAYCWGANTQGQLGNGTTADSDTTLRVPDLPTLASLTAGWLHTCALSRAGAAFCWGANGSGQLGSGDAGGYGPARVAASERLAALSAGSAHTCGLTSSGAALCWGANTAGQLGTGSTGNARRPVAVATDRPFRALAAGGVHTCALDVDGAAWCWGGNSFGQLGIGSTESARTPSAVATDLRFARIVAGGAHTCGETADGALWCWGANVQGQLGDGTLGNQPRPIRIARQ